MTALLPSFFSRCGQFLLSYTQTTADVDLVGCTIYYHYRLHWWLFLPYKRAKKVAEMMLFSNEGASELLHLREEGREDGRRAWEAATRFQTAITY